VHRIGRTGRAGLPGEAISLVSPDEDRLLTEIEKLLKRAIPRKKPDDFNPERSRERRPQREARDEPPKGESRHTAASTHRPAQPPQRAGDGFDFSKPYEPAPTSNSRETTPTPPRQRTTRPTAALLGGLRAPAKAPK